MNLSQLVFNLVQKDLENVMGPAIAAKCMNTARVKSKAPVLNMEPSQYLCMMDALASDERLTSMYGASGLKEHVKRWKDAANS